MKKAVVKIVAGVLIGVVAAGVWVKLGKRTPGAAAQETPAEQVAKDGPLQLGLKARLAAYRKIIVLLANENQLPEKDKQAARLVASALFHDNLQQSQRWEQELDTLKPVPAAQRLAQIESMLDYIESGEGLFDADRLAFRDALLALQKTVAAEQTLPSIKVHKRITDDLGALNDIEQNYDKEIRDIFARFDSRAIELKREKWEDYIARLNQIYQRDKILKEYGVIIPYAQKAPPPDEKEIFGKGLPPKTVVLTFDDGPHAAYTEEIMAILKQYHVPAVFFQVGRNVGTLSDGKEKLNGQAEISRHLLKEGFPIANHSYSHALLSKQTGTTLNDEIENTDRLLKAIDEKRSPLFRFPYGARNQEGMDILHKLGLRSVMWNIDSLDWADPVPSSIVDRVVASLNKEQRGIILFHDIHERTVKALPQVLDKLIADGYQFAAWDGKDFSVSGQRAVEPETARLKTDYQDSWAVVIGINDYQKWPKLQYAVQDANAIRDTLVQKFGFQREKVIALSNSEATRNAILAAFHEQLGHGQLKKGDRLFVFFAGHGATRQLSSGRQLGYIIPVDSDPAQLSVDAIPMTDLQNIAESLQAKHILFVMDACYSGLGLTRGGSGAFLRDNAKRIGRQMLTAGGADQMVADGGPNGHSVFTWTLLQAMSGKADLNGDGLITATELAAYVAPAVASVSQQTPAFGSLPGSEGGEFIFEVKGDSEFLNANTGQLPADAIALNNKLDGATAQAGKEQSVKVSNLSGGTQTIAMPKLVEAPARQAAQRANDDGLRWYREKQYDKAENAFTEALKLRPDFALAANNLGFVYYKQQKYPESARWFENTVKMDPSRAIAYVNLGDAYANMRETEKARKAYQGYLELAPAGSSAAYAKEALRKLDLKS